ncbi:hypothetical protein GOP47_0011273 [Adiantum capillus-veneris]|uniref:Hikeshi-like N-terminal domain-containing protein n=1 Tax=Adiantum capillus-veneris TaxID=13818 RepID=A0A9D4USG7_ADICA|nr:hypothetical protein GOP47_0011273 [Adiantum capillus-veneris]
MFGVLFPGRSFPMDASSFAQIDSTHWVLDMNLFVGEAYDQVKEMCLFLLNEYSLPPEKALAVYVQSPGSAFQYCGAVQRACPSAVLPLLWPSPGSGQMQIMAPDAAPLTAKIGLSVEDSFCTVDANRLVVPMDILDRWFKKFQDKTKRDPDYLRNFIM